MIKEKRREKQSDLELVNYAEIILDYLIDQEEAIPLFSQLAQTGISRKLLIEIVEQMDYQEYSENSLISTQKDEQKKYYCILEGQIGIFQIMEQYQQKQGLESVKNLPQIKQDSFFQTKPSFILTPKRSLMGKGVQRHSVNGQLVAEQNQKLILAKLQAIRQIDTPQKIKNSKQQDLENKFGQLIKTYQQRDHFCSTQNKTFVKQTYIVSTQLTKLIIFSNEEHVKFIISGLKDYKQLIIDFYHQTLKWEKKKIEQQPILSDLMNLKRIILKKNQTLIQEGEIADKLYIVYKGQLQILKNLSEQNLTEINTISKEDKNNLLNFYKNKKFKLSECTQNETIGEELLLNNKNYIFEVISIHKKTIVIEVPKKIYSVFSPQAKNNLEQIFMKKNIVRQIRYQKAIQNLISFNQIPIDVTKSQGGQFPSTLAPSQSMQRINFMGNYFKIRRQYSLKKIQSDKHRIDQIYDFQLYENKENKVNNKVLKLPSTKKGLLFSKLLAHKKIQMTDLQNIKDQFKTITRKLGERHLFLQDNQL